MFIASSIHNGVGSSTPAAAENPYKIASGGQVGSMTPNSRNVIQMGQPGHRRGQKFRGCFGPIYFDYNESCLTTVLLGLHIVIEFGIT